MSNNLYAKLITPFETTFKDNRGGVELEYITGEQVTTRLNETLGVLDWSFRIVEHGIHAEADEIWVLGEITVNRLGEDGKPKVTTRQQFGSQKIRRSRSSGTPQDIGHNLKGAATDAMKKCAMVLGVGLYLAKREEQAFTGSANGGSNGYSGGNNNYGSNQGSGGNFTPSQNDSGSSDIGDGFSCEECGEPLTETRFKDGTSWPPSQLAVFGRRKHSRVLCMAHYRESNAVKRRAEEALQQVPF